MKILCLAVSLLTLTFSPYSSSTQDTGLAITALDRYVRLVDPHYDYKVIKTIKGENHTSFILEMRSQKWLTEKEVNLPVWEHFMTVVAPAAIESDIGFLTISGGSKTDNAPAAPPPADVKRALETRTVVSTLYMVPNQPLVFNDEKNTRRSEDAIIAYTWDKYFRSGDEKWPLRLPMTKSAVRAMDTITDLMAGEIGSGFEVDQFVVAGGSKRGWTTWTTAVVDSRVIAIIPVVIDMLNVEASFKHHYSVYGAYAPAVDDYVRHGNMAWMGTPEFASLMNLVEPFQYRERLQLPKYLLNSTGDEFFLPDSWQFYWDKLKGEKHLRYVPNSNHSMAGTDVIDSIDAWYHAIVHNVSRPRYSWQVTEDGTITVLSLDKPTKVLLWQANNPDSRNFMQAVIGPAYTSRQLQEVESGLYKVKVDLPEKGYTAYYVELHYPSGIDAPFKFTTGVKILPDVTQHGWQMAPDEARQ